MTFCVPFPSGKAFLSKNNLGSPTKIHSKLWKPRHDHDFGNAAMIRFTGLAVIKI